MISCDFCQRFRDESGVEHMVANPHGTVHLCQDCARQCVAIIEEAKAVPAIVKPVDEHQGIGSAKEPS